MAKFDQVFRITPDPTDVEKIRSAITSSLAGVEKVVKAATMMRDAVELLSEGVTQILHALDDLPMDEEEDAPKTE